MFVLEGLVLILTCLLICYNPRDSTEDILIKTGTLVKQNGQLEAGEGGGGGGGQDERGAGDRSRSVDPEGEPEPVLSTLEACRRTRSSVVCDDDYLFRIHEQKGPVQSGPGRMDTSSFIPKGLFLPAVSKLQPHFDFL